MATGGIGAGVTALLLYAQRYLDWKVYIYIHIYIYIYLATLPAAFLMATGGIGALVTALLLCAQHHLDWKVVIYVYLFIYLSIYLSLYNVFHMMYTYAV